MYDFEIIFSCAKYVTWYAFEWTEKHNNTSILPRQKARRHKKSERKWSKRHERAANCYRRGKKKGEFFAGLLTHIKIPIISRIRIH